MTLDRALCPFCSAEKVIRRSVDSFRCPECGRDISVTEQRILEKGVGASSYNEYTIGDASRKAAKVVSEERDSHGDAYDNHKQIAELWSAFLKFKLEEEIEAWEAAIMMQQVKQSRMQAGTLIEDHFVDVSGYSDVSLYSALMDPDVEVEMDE